MAQATVFVHRPLIGKMSVLLLSSMVRLVGIGRARVAGLGGWLSWVIGAVIIAAKRA